jgi:hypothetical protein
LSLLSPLKGEDGLDITQRLEAARASVTRRKASAQSASGDTRVSSAAARCSMSIAASLSASL